MSFSEWQPHYPQNRLDYIPNNICIGNMYNTMKYAAACPLFVVFIHILQTHLTIVQLAVIYKPHTFGVRNQTWIYQMPKIWNSWNFQKSGPVLHDNYSQNWMFSYKIVSYIYVKCSDILSQNPWHNFGNVEV